MNIKILMEDTKCGGFACEHGLSILTEYHGKNYLIDAGTTGLFLENAAKMGADLSKADAVFLSHAHYDHAGGLVEFFKVNRHADVYLQKNAGNRRCYKVTGDRKKDIGIPQGMLEQYAGRFVYVDGYRDFGNGVFILPHTTKQLSARGERAHMYCETDGRMAADDFSHEQTVVFEEDGALILFNSCSHAGVENIMEEVGARFPGKKIKAFFGGFHMMGPSGISSCNFEKEEVEKVAEQLTGFRETVFYSGHCTGEVAFAWLKEILGERLAAIHAGMEIEL